MLNVLPSLSLKAVDSIRYLHSAQFFLIAYIRFPLCKTIICHFCEPIHLVYYIDRCELWGFIREINSDISHVKYQFFPAELLLHNYKCGGYIPCSVTVNTYMIAK